MQKQTPARRTIAFDLNEAPRELAGPDPLDL